MLLAGFFAVCMDVRMSGLVDILLPSGLNERQLRDARRHRPNTVVHRADRIPFLTLETLRRGFTERYSALADPPST